MTDRNECVTAEVFLQADSRSYEMKRYTSVRTLISHAALVLVALIAAPTRASAQSPGTPPGDCNRPFAEPITVIKLPSRPFNMLPTRDGCWVFVGFVQRQDAGGSGVGVLRRTGDTFEEVRVVSVPGNPNNPYGLALTNDQKVLVVSHFRTVSFFDVEKLTSGQGDPLLGKLDGPRFGYTFGVTITADDRYAFVAQGALASVLVIDIAKGRSSGFDSSVVTGLIPSVYRPTVTTPSPDGRYLYFSSKQPPDVVTPSRTCAGGKLAEGAVQIVDVQQARSDGASATVGFASPAGCEPTVVAVSPNGARLSVAAPGVVDLLSQQASADSALVVFDLLDGKTATPLGKVPLPGVPNMAVDTGNRIIVALLGADFVVIDPLKVSSGGSAIIGRMPVKAVALELRKDGRTLFGILGSQNSGGPGLAIVDLDRVPLQPATPQTAAK
jgi:hypothetical protein